MEQSSPQERERLRRESALQSLSPKIKAKIKKLSGSRWTAGSTAEAYRLKHLRLAWNMYCKQLIFAFVRVRIEVGQEYPALLENEALEELQKEIIDRVNSTDIVKRKEVEPEFEASGFPGLLGDHYLDVAGLVAFTQGQIRFARAKRDFRRTRSGLRFPVALQLLMFVTITATREVSWLGPPFIGLWLFRHQGPFLLRALYSILGSFLLCYFFYPAVRDGLMMAMVRPAWTSVNTTRVPLRGPIPGPVRLLMSNFTEAFLSIYFGILFLTRLTIFRNVTVSHFAWFMSATMFVLYLAFKSGQIGRGRKILLLRRFDRHLSSEAKRVLAPVLTAYGEVETVNDKTLREAHDLWPPEGVPTSAPLKAFSTTDRWPEDVKRKIAEADLIVMDVSDISAAIAWEFLQCVRHSEPRPIILVASARYLAAKRSAVFHEFVNELKGLSDDAESMLTSVHPPLAYSRSLVNLVFTVQLYRYIRRLTQLRRVEPGGWE
jgi:hypothetical protein